ncbi:MAG: transferase [Desulfovibrionales bacterium]
MDHLRKLFNHIVTRVNINLRKPLKDVGPYVLNAIPMKSHAQYYAFYGLTTHHPLRFRFTNSSLSGTYFLGKCEVDHSVLYKSDVRGDELKRKGSLVDVEGIEVKLHKDELIKIRDSFLIKTLIHNNSHDPESLETFKIFNTVSLHYANIHGSQVEGCFLEPFSTVDLSKCHNCTVGAFSYVGAQDLAHESVEPGRIWIRVENGYEFNYRYNPDILKKYVRFDENYQPVGIFMDFFEERKEDFVPIYSSITPDLQVHVPKGSFVSHYAVIKGDCRVGENVLIAQRAFLENANLGKGSNAQENCYIINSEYKGNNVTAHGGKVINAVLGRNTFTGFNSFVRGLADAPLAVGDGCIIMPHTIIDAEEPISIPDNHAIWGLVRRQEDLATHSISLDELAEINGKVEIGAMTFEGDGAVLVNGFKHRIEHILEENGAFFEGSETTRGHAQTTSDISYNILQPYSDGGFKGLYPDLTIGPLIPSDI